MLKPKPEFPLATPLANDGISYHWHAQSRALLTYTCINPYCSKFKHIMDELGRIDLLMNSGNVKEDAYLIRIDGKGVNYHQ